MQAWGTCISASAAPPNGSYTLLGTATGQVLQLPTSVQQQRTDRQELTNAGSVTQEPFSTGTQSDIPKSLQPQVSAAMLASEAVNTSINTDDAGFPVPRGAVQTDAGGSSTVATDLTPAGSSSPVTEEAVVTMLPKTHSSAVTSLAMSSTGVLLASLSASDGVIMLWQATPDAEQTFTLLTNMTVDEAVCVAWMPDVPQQGPPGLLIGTAASQLLVCST